MKDKNKTVLAVVAHPDDAEFTCAGTLALLKQMGWDVIMATMTPGDLGSANRTREEISRIRKAEAATAASLLQAGYYCLECDDIFLQYDKPTLLKTIELIRKVKPQIVFTMSPSCYMVDHEVTSMVVQTACFSAGIVNIVTSGTPPYPHVPHLYYVDPMEGKDKLGNRVNPAMIVDISSVIDIKEAMLKSHDSQRSWLASHHGIDEYVHSMREWSAKRGEDIGVSFGEGFRQHLGHAFPQENILKKELSELVIVTKG